MKFLLILLFSATLISANSLIVKDSTIVVSLNNVNTNLKVGNEVTLDNGTTICFKSGEGRAIINNDVQLMKPDSCHLLPPPKDFNLKELFLKFETYVYARMSSKEKSIDGVSTKGMNSFDDRKDIVLKRNIKDLIIYSKEFGPYPITINLKDEKESIVLSVQNEHEDITFFKVLSSSVNTGYSIEVLDGYGRIILTKKIIKE